MTKGQAAALAAAFTGALLASTAFGPGSGGSLGLVLAAQASAGPSFAPERSPFPQFRPLPPAPELSAEARPMPRPVPAAATATVPRPPVLRPAPAEAAASSAIPPTRPGDPAPAEVAAAPPPAPSDLAAALAPEAEAPTDAATGTPAETITVALQAAPPAAPGDTAEAMAALKPRAADAEDDAAIPLPVALRPAEAPAPRADEPLPRVATPGAGDLRPQPRPLPAGGAELPTRAAVGPLALAARPPARPEDFDPVAAVSTSAAISPLAVSRSRLPLVRPEAERRRFLQRASAVRAAPSSPPAATTTGRATGNLCGVAGIAGRSIPPVTSRVQGCGVASPVQVTAVDGVRLSQAATMDCDTARALHTWVRTGLRPAVGTLGGGVTELRIAGHYVCRTRNHRPGARISEHGRGRAIDISAIRLADGRTMSVLQHWRHGTFGPVLRAAHRAACGPFNTTLGPGSDGMHEDHFHYDLRRGGRFCR